MTGNDQEIDPAVDPQQDDYIQRRAAKIKMRLAVMNHMIGQRLEKDIYHDEKIVARAGQPITRVMIERLQEFDPGKMRFTTGGQRRLDTD